MTNTHAYPKPDNLNEICKDIIETQDVDTPLPFLFGIRLWPNFSA